MERKSSIELTGTECSNHGDGEAKHKAMEDDEQRKTSMLGEENIRRLYEASKMGSIQILQTLIQEDNEIIQKALISSYTDETPLHVTISHNHLQFARYLLNMNHKLVVEVDSFQRTPLHLACANGNIDIVRVLLENNTSACLIRDSNGLIPLHYAVIEGEIEIMQMLISARPPSIWTKLGNNGQTVLHLGVKHNHLDVVKKLIELVIHDQKFLNSADLDGNTILDLSLTSRKIEMIRYLLTIEGINVGNGITRVPMNMTTPNSTEDYKKLSHHIEIEHVPSSPSPQPQPRSPPSPARERGTIGCWKRLRNYQRYRGDWTTEVQGTLMLVASVIATMTFQGASNPPGGVWQQDTLIDGITYNAGTSILASKKNEIYGFVLAVNNLSFMASITVILLIISGFPLRSKIGAGLLKLVMCTAVYLLCLSCLIGSYMVNNGREYVAYVGYMLFAGALNLVVFYYAIRFLILVVKFMVWAIKRISQACH